MLVKQPKRRKDIPDWLQLYISGSSSVKSTVKLGSIRIYSSGSLHQLMMNMAVLREIRTGDTKRILGEMYAGDGTKAL